MGKLRSVGVGRNLRFSYLDDAPFPNQSGLPAEEHFDRLYLPRPESDPDRGSG